VFLDGNKYHYVIRAIKLKSKKLVENIHVAYMENMRDSYKILIGKYKGTWPLEDLDVDGRILFKRILKK
jgi:hypothetical protein